MEKEKNNSKKALLSVKLLYNIKWIGAVISAIYGIMFLECATDSSGISSSEEYIMYTFWISLLVTIALFVYNRKWIEFCNRIINRK